MRSVADHHVDRPGMQARQRVQSTGTNPPIGLIRSGEGGSMSVTELTDRSPHRSPARAPGGGAVQRGNTVSSEAPADTSRPRRHPTLQAPELRTLARSGGHSARGPPGPNPNP